MSTLGDILSALRSVILLQDRMDQLDKRLTRTADDMGGLTDALTDVRDRVSRLEGIIEGAMMASRQRRIEE